MTSLDRQPRRQGLSAARAERQEKCIALRRAGGSWVEIARTLGYENGVAARKSWEAAQDRLFGGDPANNQAMLRIEEGDRLDAMWRAHWPKRAETDHAKVLLRVSELRAKLFGLNYAEAKIADGVSAMGVAQLAQASMLHSHLIDAMGRAGAPLDLQDRIIQELNKIITDQRKREQEDERDIPGEVDDEFDDDPDGDPDDSAGV